MREKKKGRNGIMLKTEETMPYSNITKEELEAKLKQQKREREASEKCPACGARRFRENSMRRFEDEIGRFLRENRFVKMDSCILCVEKHVARAMVYHEELMTAKDSGASDGTASVSVMKNHLKILGHLGCAIEESEDFTELNELLIQTERNYRYEGLGPDWEKITESLTREACRIKKEKNICS